MRAPFAMAAAAALVGLGCAPSAPPARPASPPPAPVALRPTAPSGQPSAAAAARPPVEDPAVREDADAAVAELAALLERVEADCSAKWLAPDMACNGAPFLALATRYQRVFGARPDPRSEQGRIDALPRLGGPGQTDELVAARMANVCAERCDLARRTAVVDAVEAAVERCVTDPAVGRRACQELSTRAGSPPSEAASKAAEKCGDQCAWRAEQARLEEGRERARPRTPQQSRICFRACMMRCTGGRIVPPLDRPFVSPADEWCGTCQMSCEASCAVR